MLPTNMTEASCAKCHKQEVYVPNADKLTIAYATFERAGCYACHKTKGFDVEHEEARADPDEDRLEADAGLGEDLDPESARGQGNHVDAALLVQLEQQLARRRRAQRGRDQRDRRVSVRERGQARVRRQEPAARRREGGRDDREVDRLPRLPRRGRRLAQRGRAAPHVRPAARERRQQDDLRVDLQLGSRSEALQPGHLHAGSAADRCAGGRCRDLSLDAQRAGRRRGEGDSGSAGGRRRSCSIT